MELLTDEQYFKMADSLGIVEFGKVNTENFSMSREEARRRINAWFESGDGEEDGKDDSMQAKAKRAMADELFKRLSKERSKNVINKLKTKRLEEESAKSAMSINIDHLSEQELERLF